jgi:hypothetical protein
MESPVTALTRLMTPAACDMRWEFFCVTTPPPFSGYPFPPYHMRGIGLLSGKRRNSAVTCRLA